MKLCGCLCPVFGNMQRDTYMNLSPVRVALQLQEMQLNYLMHTRAQAAQHFFLLLCQGTRLP